MPNWVQNEIIFENADDEKVAALIRELKASVETDEPVAVVCEGDGLFHLVPKAKLHG